MEPKYKRVLLKLSGEALAGEKGTGLDHDMVARVANQVAYLIEQKVEVGLVIGGGNFWRGRTSQHMDRATADHMGMLATVINALAIQDALDQINVQNRVLSAIDMRQIAEPYIKRRAIRHLEKGRVVIFLSSSLRKWRIQKFSLIHNKIPDSVRHAQSKERDSNTQIELSRKQISL